MDILQQCQKWHENDEHQKIIDTLEAIPQEAHTADIDMELARAYNNLGAPGEPEGRRMLKHAIELMQAHEEELKETYFWNFRMGYAWYYLDQEGRAIPYLRKALELHPGDDPKLNSRQDIEEFLEDCTRRTSLPRFAECFRERTETAWEAFAEQEAALRRTMDEDKNHERGKELESDSVKPSSTWPLTASPSRWAITEKSLSWSSRRRGTRSVCLSWSISKSTHPRRYWSTGISWSGRRRWRISACAQTAGRFPATMCRFGWKSWTRTALACLPTAKSCFPCCGRRKAGPGGCSPPSLTRCWARFPTCGTSTPSTCWRRPRRHRPFSSQRCPTN